jgi:photosystem II stability/assembly factor-like uncharacterized protein
MPPAWIAILLIAGMDTRLLIGTNTGLFIAESDDRREDWRISGPHHAGWQVYAAHGHGDELIAGLSSPVWGASLHRSDDGGRTWAPMDTPAFPEGSPRKLAQIWSLEHQNGTLHAGVAEAALFSSAGSGGWKLNEGLENHPTRSRWQPGAGGLCLHTILPDEDRAYVAISSVGVGRSDDGGQSWELKNEGVVAADADLAAQFAAEQTCCTHKLVRDPANSNVLFQQNHVGVFRSGDAGDSWERIENGLPSFFGFGMVMHPRDPLTLYNCPISSQEIHMVADGRLRVYQTRDGGDSWNALDRGLPQQCYANVLRDALAIDKQDPAGVYVGTTGGEVFASTDEGESWSRLPASFARVLCIKVAP